LERAPVLALRLLITRLPNRMAARVITAVCATLTMFGFVLFGVLTDTEIGPFLQQIVTVSIAVPMIVVTPFASVAIMLVRQLEADRAEALALAGTDTLTDLPNRRRLTELLERDLVLARRMGRPLMVAMLDVDDFKTVNDAHGHDTGDRLLRAIAETCRRCTRTTDVVGRWGGEEFALLLPDTGREGARVLLERIRIEIAATVILAPNGQALARTVSIGAIELSTTVCRTPAPEVHDLLTQADRVMYRAKMTGKNQVLIEGPAEAEPVAGSTDPRGVAERQRALAADLPQVAIDPPRGREQPILVRRG